MFKIAQVISLLIVSVVVVGCSSTRPPVSETRADVLTSDTAMMKVSDQPAEKFVMIDTLVLLKPGFVVIHADADGKPGEVLGQSQALPAGTYRDLPVDFNQSKAGAGVFAMIHNDDGNGAFEFPGPDSPMTVDGNILVEPIRWK